MQNKTTSNEASPLFRKEKFLSCSVFLLLLVSLLYNPAYFYAPGNPWPFYFMPQEAVAFLALALFVPGIAEKGFPFAEKKILPCLFYGGLTIYTVFSLIHIFADFPRHGLWNLGFLIFPTAILLFFLRQCEKLSGKFIAGAILPFGILNLYLIISARLTGHSLHFRSGITGNSNWTAAITTVTAGAFLFFLYTFFRKKCSPFKTFLLLLLPAAGMIFLWKNQESLGSFLAILSTLYLLLFIMIPGGKIRKLVTFSSILSGIVLMLLFVHFKQDAIADRFAADERLTLWEGTVNMILDNPVTGAGGSCCYENKFIPYKPIELFLKSHVAPRASHPHNEILYILASGGILTGLPLIFLLLFPVFYLYISYLKEKPDSWELLIFAMYLYFIFHGQLDCFFPKYPNQLFLWMFCSYCWSRVFLHKKNKIALSGNSPEEK